MQATMHEAVVLYSTNCEKKTNKTEEKRYARKSN